MRPTIACLTSGAVLAARCRDCCYKPTVGGCREGRRSTDGEATVEPIPEDDALLGVARRAMDASVPAAAALGGLSPVQLRALTVLLQFPGANVVQLADEM